MKSLDELNARKQLINSEVDLEKECQSIRELDGNINQLDEKIRTLHESVKYYDNLLSTTCEKLAAPNRILSRAIKAYELTSRLTNLNRLCRRLDTSPCLKYIESLEGTESAGNKSSVPGSNTVESANSNSTRLNEGPKNSKSNDVEDEEEDNDEGLVVDKKAVMKIVQDLVVEFEQIFSGELKSIVEKRLDLPYVHYNSVIKRAKQSIASLSG